MWLARRAVTLGDTVGNNYSITSGLNAGDKVIVSGTQFLVERHAGDAAGRLELRCMRLGHDPLARQRAELAPM